MPRILTRIQRTARPRRCVLLLTLALLLPQLGWAQILGFGSPKFENGSYVLESDRTVRHPAQIRLLEDDRVVVKEGNENRRKLWPGDVYSLHIADRKYVKLEDFRMGRKQVEIAFVELVDSGRVVLMKYDYPVGSPSAMGANGTMMGGGSSNATAYLLSGPAGAGPTVVPESNSKKSVQKFQETLRPYLAARPDLLQLLEQERITYKNLVAAIHALNTNSPFTPAD
ncbi:MAG: hypothetical protein ACRYFX_23870 [Janthinobacterium lividum]